MKVYIAGPMRGYDHFNFPAFDAVAADLRYMGAEVRSPAEHDRETGFDETLNSLDGFDLKAALRWDIDTINNWADTVVLLPGWEKSSGVAIELTVARAVGCLVFEVHEDNERPGCLSYFTLSKDEQELRLRTPSQDVDMVVNEQTGGVKGSKLARFDLVPPGPMFKVAEVYGIGARKYAERNWEKGYDWSLSYASMLRHALQFWGGEDIDPQDGQHHLASVVFHALALMQFAETHPELDDRSVGKEAA